MTFRIIDQADKKQRIDIRKPRIDIWKSTQIRVQNKQEISYFFPAQTDAGMVMHRHFVKWSVRFSQMGSTQLNIGYVSKLMWHAFVQTNKVYTINSICLDKCVTFLEFLWKHPLNFLAIIILFCTMQNFAIFFYCSFTSTRQSARILEWNNKTSNARTMMFKS